MVKSFKIKSFIKDFIKSPQNSSSLMHPILSNHLNQKEEIILKTELAFHTLTRKGSKRTRRAPWHKHQSIQISHSTRDISTSEPCEGTSCDGLSKSNQSLCALHDNCLNFILRAFSSAYTAPFTTFEIMYEDSGQDWTRVSKKQDFWLTLMYNFTKLDLNLWEIYWALTLCWTIQTRLLWVGLFSHDIQAVAKRLNLLFSEIRVHLWSGYSLHLETWNKQMKKGSVLWTLSQRKSNKYYLQNCPPTARR